MIQTDTRKVHEFLANHPVGVLSTASPSGEPWGSTVIFATDEELNFYFMTRANTQKYRNIAANPHVALTITDQARQITVQATGVAAKVATEDILEVVFQKLDKLKPQGSEHWVDPVYKIHEGDYMILQVKPTALQYADFSRPPEDADTKFIEQII
jgi:general stress protein 26